MRDQCRLDCVVYLLLKPRQYARLRNTLQRHGSVKERSNDYKTDAEEFQTIR